MDNAELTKRVMDLDERATRHTEQIKTLFNQVGETQDLAKGVYDLVGTVKVLASEQSATRSKVDALAKDISDIKDKPGRKWDSVISWVIQAVVLAIMAFLLAKIGLN